MVLKPYRNLDEAWKQILTDLLDEGQDAVSRHGDTKELLGYSFKLKNPEGAVLMNPRRNLNPFYLAAEVVWYFMDTHKADFILKFAPNYGKYLEEDGTAYWAYGPRFVEDLCTVIELLQLHPDSRRAVIALWDSEADLSHSLAGDVKDVPCIVSFQFILRDDGLHMITYQRSQDMWVGFPNDIFSFTLIQMIVAGSLGVAAATYTHNMGSCHFYRDHYQRISAALREPTTTALNAFGDQPTYGSMMQYIRSKGRPTCDFTSDLANLVGSGDVYNPALKQLKERYANN